MINDNKSEVVNRVVIGGEVNRHRFIPMSHRVLDIRTVVVHPLPNLVTSLTHILDTTFTTLYKINSIHRPTASRTADVKSNTRNMTGKCCSSNNMLTRFARNITTLSATYLPRNNSTDVTQVRGTAARTRISLKLGGRLKEITGGLGKIFFSLPWD